MGYPRPSTSQVKTLDGLNGSDLSQFYSKLWGNRGPGSGGVCSKSPSMPRKEWSQHGL